MHRVVGQQALGLAQQARAALASRLELPLDDAVPETLSRARARPS